MIFRIYNSSFGFKYNGVKYSFVHTESFTVEDPEMTKLVRGANAGDKVGLVYKEGNKEPKKITVTVKGMTADIKAILDQMYENQDRVDVYCVDRTSGSSKTGADAILTQMPQQLNIEESPDSMNVVLAFETFDLSEDHKE